MRDFGLEEALAADAIHVRYQPLVDPRSFELRGVEALARWVEPDNSCELFDRAAGSGLTERLSRQVQQKALAEAASWDGPLAGLRLSINCVAEDLVRDGYEQWLVEQAREAGFDLHRLTLEITETKLVSDSAAAARKLHFLRGHGVSIALDDFGSGYANLAYITALPLDWLKLDRSLLADIVAGRRDRIVVRAMIDMARDLGLLVVAEGIESHDQLDLVVEWGCDLVQGFLVSGALKDDELARFAEGWR